MRAVQIALVPLMSSTAVMAHMTKAQNNDREIDLAKKADITKQFEVTNTTEQAQLVMRKYREILSQTYMDVPEEWWDDVLSVMITTSFQNMLIPIYDRHFTHEEITGTIELFETPAGQRYIREYGSRSSVGSAGLNGHHGAHREGRLQEEVVAGRYMP